VTCGKLHYPTGPVQAPSGPRLKF